MFTFKPLFLAALALHALLVSKVEAIVVYNAGADFSIAGNPNSTWSYGYSSLNIGPFTPFSLYPTSDATAYNQVGLERWSITPGIGSDDTAYPFLMVNAGPNIISVLDITVNPAQMVLHPGASGEVSILRWTAPGAGLIDIETSFFGMSNVTSTTDVHVYHNSGSLFDALINLSGNPNQQDFNTQMLSVSSGDIIQFVIGAGGNGYQSDSTGLFAEISFTPESVNTVIPEPSSFCLLGMGLLGFSARRRLHGRD